MTPAVEAPPVEQASPDSLTSELNREERKERDADTEDAGNMGDVEQVPRQPHGTVTELINQYLMLYVLILTCTNNCSVSI